MAAIDENRLARLCKYTRLLGMISMIAIPGIIVWYWYSPTDFPLGAYDAISMYLEAPPLPIFTRATGLAVSLLPAGALLIGILGLYRLAGVFKSGRFISQDTSDMLRLAAYGFIAYGPFNILHSTMLVALLTFGRPPGQRVLVVSVEGGDVVLMMVGLLLLALSQVFVAERERAEDQALII